MAKINLLPADLGPKASVLKLANLGKKVAVIISLSFLIFGILLGGYIIFLNLELRNSNSKQTSLKTSISSLQSTEQSLYLLKERIGKIRLLLTKEPETSVFESTNNALFNISGINFTHILVSADKTTVSGNSQSTSALSTFFAGVLASETYKTAKLTTFSFNPKLGYVFGLELNTK